MVFTDTNPSVWFQNGGTNNLPAAVEMRHSLSNPLAVFGLRSTPRGVANYSTASAQLRSDDGNTVLDLAPGQITITAQTVNVNCTDATVTASHNANINGSNQVNLNGGTVTLGPATHIDGKTFLTHVHTGVQGLAELPDSPWKVAALA